MGGGQELEAEAEPAAGLLLGDAEVGRGLPVVEAPDVGPVQGGAQRGRHGVDDVVGAGGDGGAAHGALQFLAPRLLPFLPVPQPLHGDPVGDGGDPGAQRALPGVVGLGVLPDVGEDLAGDGVGGLFVGEDAVGETVHEGGEAVVQLAEGGRLTAREPLLHLAVPAGRYVLPGHAVPSPHRVRPVQPVGPVLSNVVGTSDNARPFGAMCAPGGAAGDSAPSTRSSHKSRTSLIEQDR
ncbi:hypothetical protein GCM10010206_10640 [Streptomyces cinerochromogenes]|nr:hypothetical protein GCM10010206_10640 [Streptomyces cinerochromogenes]